MYNHSFKSSVKKIVNGKEHTVRECHRCHSVMVEGDWYFNMHCMEATKEMEQAIKEVIAILQSNLNKEKI